MKTHVDERVAFEPVQGLLTWGPCMSFGMVQGSLEIVCNIAAFFFFPWGRKSFAPIEFSKSSSLAGTKTSNIYRHSGPQAPSRAFAQCLGLTDGTSEARGGDWLAGLGKVPVGTTGD